MAQVNILGKISLNETAPNIDIKYGPYKSLQEAWTFLEDAGEHACVGLTVGILGADGSISEYWFKDKAESVNDLVLKAYKELPDGGNEGDILVKTASGELAWQAPGKDFSPENTGAIGQVLKKTATGTIWANEKTELPTISSADKNKVLKVNEQGTGVVWATDTDTDTDNELPSMSGQNNKVLRVKNGEAVWDNETTEVPSAQASDQGKVLKVDAQGNTYWGSDEVGITEKELPNITASDNRKILRVIDGKAAWDEEQTITHPKELPEIPEDSEGKILQVNSEGTLEWRDIPEAEKELPTEGTEGHFLKLGYDRSPQWASVWPTNGVKGKVLTHSGSATPTWEDVPSELPSGGAVGDILQKTNTGTKWWSIPEAMIELCADGNPGKILGRDADDNVIWIDPPESSTQLPEGGNEGDILQTDGEGNLSWVPMPENTPELPTGGTNNQILQIVDGQPKWVDLPEVEDELPKAGAEGSILVKRGDSAKWEELTIDKELPENGQRGQLLQINNSGNVAWVNPEDVDGLVPEFPIGEPGQFLQKQADGNVAWGSITIPAPEEGEGVELPPANENNNDNVLAVNVIGDTVTYRWKGVNEVPRDGEEGQVLTTDKDGNPVWTTIEIPETPEAAPELPENRQDGQLLQVDGENLKWVNPSDIEGLEPEWPEGGTKGQFLQMGENGIPTWESLTITQPDSPNEGVQLPPITAQDGGNVLAVTEDADGYQWKQIVGVPTTGATSGHVLTAGADGKPVWAAPESAELPDDSRLVPEEGTVGQILKKTANGAAWANESTELPTATAADAGAILQVGADGKPVWANEIDADTHSHWPALSGNKHKVLKVNDNETGTYWAEDSTGQNLPAYSTNDGGKVLTVDPDGNGTSWQPVEAGSSLPNMTGKAGKVLTVSADSSEATWQDAIPFTSDDAGKILKVKADGASYGWEEESSDTAFPELPEGADTLNNTYFLTLHDATASDDKGAEINWQTLPVADSKGVVLNIGGKNVSRIHTKLVEGDITVGASSGVTAGDNDNVLELTPPADSLPDLNPGGGTTNSWSDYVAPLANIYDPIDSTSKLQIPAEFLPRTAPALGDLPVVENGYSGYMTPLANGNDSGSSSYHVPAALLPKLNISKLFSGLGVGGRVLKTKDDGSIEAVEVTPELPDYSTTEKIGKYLRVRSTGLSWEDTPLELPGTNDHSGQVLRVKTDGEVEWSEDDRGVTEISAGTATGAGISADVVIDGGHASISIDVESSRKLPTRDEWESVLAANNEAVKNIQLSAAEGLVGSTTVDGNTTTVSLNIAEDRILPTVEDWRNLGTVKSIRVGVAESSGLQLNSATAPTEITSSGEITLDVDPSRIIPQKSDWVQRSKAIKYYTYDAENDRYILEEANEMQFVLISAEQHTALKDAGKLVHGFAYIISDDFTTDVTDVAAPVLSFSEYDEGGNDYTQLSWIDGNPDEPADYYQVYSRVKDSTDWGTAIATIDKSAGEEDGVNRVFTYSQLALNTEYAIVAHKEIGVRECFSNKSNVVSTPTLAAPTNLAPKEATDYTLVWTAVNNATHYTVFANSATVESNLETTTFENVALGVAYCVRAQIQGAGRTLESVDSSTITLTLGAPTTVTVTYVGPDDYQVSWEAVEGATQYKVVNDGKGGNDYVVDEVIEGDTVCTGLRATQVIDRIFTVTAQQVTSGGITLTATTSTKSDKASLNTPSNVEVETLGDGTKRIVWDEVDGADSYELKEYILSNDANTLTDAENVTYLRKVYPEDGCLYYVPELPNGASSYTNLTGLGYQVCAKSGSKYSAFSELVSVDVHTIQIELANCKRTYQIDSDNKTTNPYKVYILDGASTNFELTAEAASDYGFTEIPMDHVTWVSGNNAVEAPDDLIIID